MEPRSFLELAANETVCAQDGRYALSAAWCADCRTGWCAACEKGHLCEPQPEFLQVDDHLVLANTAEDDAPDQGWLD